MIGRLGGVARRYLAVLGLAPKLFMAYRAWFWMGLWVQILALVIFVFFWRAVYAGQATLGGLTEQQTLNYIMLAQVMLPTVQSYLVFHIGEMLVDGQFAMQLLRPLDVQAAWYAEAFGQLWLQLLYRVPLGLFAWLVLDLRLPADPAIWGAFLLTLALGHAVLFCFDWMFACLAFYTTESWGLAMVHQSIATFFSGALIPLAMMPDWLERLTLSLPFAQALWVPVSILSGITPVHEVPRLWLIQLLWLGGMLAASRLVFRIGVRKVTIQGG